ncbi:tripartite tricarboxylate transporter substrate binding protein [Pigmentiphaga soli]|uniref:Tripartite tricarboxylate transporter substrate binding protein n=1 Tax=Pigmentiphaga soli TaxID=1007095 RepID=A0ABP8GHJ6_9BURK
MTSHVKRIAAVLLGGCAAAAAGPAPAQQDYPNKPIRFLVGSAPGGTTDLVARAISQKMGALLGQQVVVDNRPGANQMIAADMTAKAPPDGYTLLMAPAGFAINPAIYKKLAYDPVKDFTPIAMVANAPNVLVVHPSVPARSVKELVALMKARPGALNYGSSGVGSPSHLSGALLEMLTRTKATHVPYKGSGPAMTDLLGGQLQMSFPSIPGAIPYINAGKLIPLGVTSKDRSQALPQVPTIAESGVPGYEVGSWFGVMGPGGMDRRLVARLNDIIRQTLAAPEIRQALMKDGAEPSGGTPEEFAATVNADIEKWGKVIRAAGISPE